MNTTTKTELAEVSQSNIATLPPAARAAVVLKSEQTRKELTALAAQSAGIVTVLNADGREQAHRLGMTLKGARVAIEKTGKAAREDATAFSKAVIAEEKALIGLIEPEETRVLKLRDAWDEKIEAEKQAKIAAERARIEAIASAIEGIRERETDVVRLTKTADDATREIECLRDMRIAQEVYQERLAEALTLKETVLQSMIAIRDSRIEAEAAARAAEEARKAEAARIEAERAELARLRAEQAERERLAKIESDRIAAEQAAEAKRLADLAAAQEAEARLQREAEAARVRAEQAERDRVAVETKRQLDAQQAAIAAERAAFVREQEEARVRAEAVAQLERDHAEALAMNAQFDIDREAERVRLQALTDQHLADNRLPPPESYSEQDALIDAGIEPDASDEQIIAAAIEAVEGLGLSRHNAVKRLATINFAEARAPYEVAA